MDQASPYPDNPSTAPETHNYEVLSRILNWMLERGIYIDPHSEATDGPMAPALNFIASVEAQFDAMELKQEQLAAQLDIKTMMLKATPVAALRYRYCEQFGWPSQGVTEAEPATGFWYWGSTALGVPHYASPGEAIDAALAQHLLSVAKQRAANGLA